MPPPLLSSRVSWREAAPQPPALPLLTFRPTPPDGFPDYKKGELKHGKRKRGRPRKLSKESRECLEGKKSKHGERAPKGGWATLWGALGWGLGEAGWPSLLLIGALHVLRPRAQRASGSYANGRAWPGGPVWGQQWLQEEGLGLDSSLPA